MPGTPLRYSRSAYNWKLAPLVHAMRDLLGQRGLSWLLRAPAEASGYPTGQEPSGYWPRCRCGAFRRFFSVHSRRSCSFGVEVFVGTTTKTGELLLTKAQKSMFKTTTVNRYLRRWGYDHETLRRQPTAVRFQAEHSNDCWQFDLSSWAPHSGRGAAFIQSMDTRAH